MSNDDVTTIVAVLSSQMGELKHAVHQSTGEFARRLTAVEEWQIRADERAKGDDKLRRVLADDRRERDEHDAQHVTLSLARWQVWLAALAAVAMIAAVVVALVSLVTG